MSVTRPRVAAIVLSTLVGLVGLVPPAVAAPANDDRANATFIPSLPFTDSLNTSEATTEATEPLVCGYIGATVWYSYTPPADQEIAADTFGSDFDTVLAVYEAGSVLGPLEEPVACNDDVGKFGGPSRVRLVVRAGTSYEFQVGGYFGATGNLVFNVAPPPPPPGNDDRANATEIPSLPYTNTQPTDMATMESGEDSCGGYAGATVWYKHLSPVDQIIIADTAGSTFTTTLAVYDAANLSKPISCTVGRYYEEKPAILRVSAVGGTRYFFQVGGFFGDTGRLVFNVSPPPANDRRASALTISQLPFTHSQDTTAAGLEAGEPRPCGGIDATVWFTYTAAADGPLLADTVGSGFDTVLAAYRAEDLATPIACNDDAVGKSAAVQFAATGGAQYYFQAGGFYGASGSLVFNLASSASIMPSDITANAVVISALPFSHVQATEGATLDEGEARPCGRIERTVWYRYTAAVDQAIVADTYPSDFDTVLAVYDSENLSLPVACNDDGSGRQSDVLFTAAAGRTYYLQAGGRLGSSGLLKLRVEVAPPPPPDPLWPSLDSAVIRPGTRLYIEEHGRCTANFVFRGKGRRAGKLYVGIAAHCVEQDIGARVRLTNSAGPVVGAVAYSSWKEMNLLRVECEVVFTCYGGGDPANDFALIEINADFADDVHPAMLHFGGPTGIVPFAEVEIGDKVVTYGNSPYRQGVDELNSREGYVAGKGPPWSICVYTVTPGVFGDSGSGALLGDGRALGVVVTIYLLPPGQNGVASLSAAMEFAKSTGWEPDLQTWPLLAPGLLPAIGAIGSDASNLTC